MSNLSPVSVYEYRKESLVSLIHFKTNCVRAEILSKWQFIYLTSYLKSDHMKASTMVVEDEYTDRHYLEDYTAYYARCFNEYPRFSTRVHFFSNKFGEEDFLDALSQNKDPFFQKLKNGYLGYLVIKPIPNAFMGGVYVKPYKGIIDDEAYRLIHKSHHVSLAGIDLQLETVGFTEQDEVVSACATSAIWSYLNAYGLLATEQLPSPSAITQAATNLDVDGGRIFPAEGLTDIQILRSIKHFGLETISAEIEEEDGYNSQLLKEYIYAYSTNDIPVLIAGDVYQWDNTIETYRKADQHLICSLGFHLSKSVGHCSPNLVASRIDKYYVHDDRVGPYARLKDEQTFTVKGPDDVSRIYRGLEQIIISNENSKRGEIVSKEYFVPIEIYIGVYHKIRVPYLTVKKLCLGLFAYAKTLRDRADTAEDGDAKRAILRTLDLFLESDLSITLTTNSKLKKEVITDGNAVYSFNGIDRESGKLEFIVKNMPKYIWDCSIRGKADNQYLRVLFDATEIPKGNLLIGYLAYSPEAVLFWTIISQDAKEYFYGDKQSLSEDVSAFYELKPIRSIVKLLCSSERDSYLNSIFGPNRLPQRDLKDGEANYAQNIPNRPDLVLVKLGTQIKLGTLQKETNYIWVIDENADFVYGEDIATPASGDFSKVFKGHPTLIDNAPARLAGELLFLQEKSCWQINLFSGNYSQHIKDQKRRKIFLEGVVKNFFGDEGSIDIDSRVTRS